MDIAIKHFQGVITVFKEFRIFGFENCCNVAEQISSGLEIIIKCKDCHI